jgi:hypothetical protein
MGPCLLIRLTDGREKKGKGKEIGKWWDYRRGFLNEALRELQRVAY